MEAARPRQETATFMAIHAAILEYSAKRSFEFYANFFQSLNDRHTGAREELLPAELEVENELRAADADVHPALRPQALAPECQTCHFHWSEIHVKTFNIQYDSYSQSIP